MPYRWLGVVGLSFIRRPEKLLSRSQETRRVNIQLKDNPFCPRRLISRPLRRCHIRLGGQLSSIELYCSHASPDSRSSTARRSRHLGHALENNPLRPILQLDTMPRENEQGTRRYVQVVEDGYGQAL